MKNRLAVFFTAAVVIFACLANPPIHADVPVQTTAKLDTRMVSLGKFFEKYKCPKPYYIDEYIKYADEYQIDYRLVAAISLKESTCGKHYRYNNWWGWMSARSGFDTVPDGIKFVSELLSPNCALPPYKSNGINVKNPCSPFKGKTINQQLATYGPHDNSNYAGSVIGYMNQIK